MPRNFPKATTTAAIATTPASVTAPTTDATGATGSTGSPTVSSGGGSSAGTPVTTSPATTTPAPTTTPTTPAKSVPPAPNGLTAKQRRRVSLATAAAYRTALALEGFNRTGRRVSLPVAGGVTDVPDHPGTDDGDAKGRSGAAVRPRGSRRVRHVAGLPLPGCRFRCAR